MCLHHTNKVWDIRRKEQQIIKSNNSVDVKLATLSVCKSMALRPHKQGSREGEVGVQ